MGHLLFKFFYRQVVNFWEFEPRSFRFGLLAGDAPTQINLEQVHPERAAALCSQRRRDDRIRLEPRQRPVVFARVVFASAGILPHARSERRPSQEDRVRCACPQTSMTKTPERFATASPTALQGPLPAACVRARVQRAASRIEGLPIAVNRTSPPARVLASPLVSSVHESGSSPPRRRGRRMLTAASI